MSRSVTACESSCVTVHEISNKTFSLGLEFLEKNKDQDNWFLQLETFDPHEPFHAPDEFLKEYPHEYHGKVFDWPPYKKVTESDEVVQHLRDENAALVSFCDQQLGRILDFMDENDMWKDTMLIVNTDHGYLLGEHGWWAKGTWYYNEVANTPLFMWDPRYQKKGESRKQLVQTIDLAPTILNAFGLEPTKDMMGISLSEILENPLAKGHDAVLFGLHGSHVNITDGHYVYMRGWGDNNKPVYNYTFMPTHVSCMFTTEELEGYTIGPEFSFTKGTRPIVIPHFIWS